MRVITFSRVFPKTHPKAGESTYFVEKIWKGLYDIEPSSHLPFDWTKYDEAFPVSENYDRKLNIHEHAPKYHTVRAGERWKVGQVFSARVWSGKPYASKQIEFAQIEIKKIWNIEVLGLTWLLNDKPLNTLEIHEIGQNDGLSYKDFKDWFKLPFNGQILCWNDEIDYAA